MTIDEMLFKYGDSTAIHAAHLFAHSFDQDNYKILNLVAPISQGYLLAESVYNYVRFACPDILFVTDKEFKKDMLASATTMKQKAFRRKYTGAACFILAADDNTMNMPPVQAELDRLLFRRYDHNLKTLIITEKALTEYGRLYYLTASCDSVPVLCSPNEIAK